MWRMHSNHRVLLIESKSRKKDNRSRSCFYRKNSCPFWSYCAQTSISISYTTKVTNKSCISLLSGWNLCLNNNIACLKVFPVPDLSSTSPKYYIVSFSTSFQGCWRTSRSPRLRLTGAVWLNSPILEESTKPTIHTLDQSLALSLIFDINCLFCL
jgi:hypothetical protein